ncbi:MAG TPA: DNA-processing protein DprA [Myxococcota bacterium]|nr:DNA-processing protein DprA [Myxococcota bacterium]
MRSDREPRVLDPADARHAPALGAWLAFQRAFALKPEQGAALLRRHGDPARALAACGVTPALHPERELTTLCRVGSVGVPLGSDAYPPRLAEISDPAPLLLVRGDARALSERSVAIVGARAATLYGRQVARRLAAELAREGVAIVSGLARGIDAEAHRGALEAGGRTVAVQACGIDCVYPSQHRALAERIAASGAVVAELPLGTPPRRPYFPLRNRLISGLSCAVVIVEARERSGSLITADHAARQGRDVFAVPGPITAPTSLGTNRLLRDGAFVALGSDDILGELGITRSARASERARDGLSPRARELLEAIAQAPASRDELARRLAVEPAQLALELIELELAQRIGEDRDGRLRALPRAD